MGSWPPLLFFPSYLALPKGVGTGHAKPLVPVSPSCPSSRPPTLRISALSIPSAAHFPQGATASLPTHQGTHISWGGLGYEPTAWRMLGKHSPLSRMPDTGKGPLTTVSCMLSIVPETRAMDVTGTQALPQDAHSVGGLHLTSFGEG